MGLFAIPVSSRGLSVLLGQSEDAPEEGDEGAPVDMSEQQSKLRQLQAFLNVPQTGSPDDVTRDALKQFQWSKGLPQTGALDAETLRFLGEANADLASITKWDVLRTYWWAYKWWVLGGAAVLVGGGLLIRRARRK